MFQDRSSALVVINHCIGFQRQCSTVFFLKRVRSIHTLHVLRSLLLSTPDASERRQTGTCRLLARCGKRWSQGSAELVWAGVLGPERISARIIEVVLDRADSSERASRHFPRRGASVAIVLPGS